MTLVISSTCSPSEVRELASGLDESPHHVIVVDAPFSGGAMTTAAQTAGRSIVK